MLRTSGTLGRYARAGLFSYGGCALLHSLTLCNTGSDKGSGLIDTVRTVTDYILLSIGLGSGRRLRCSPFLLLGSGRRPSVFRVVFLGKRCYCECKFECGLRHVIRR